MARSKSATPSAPSVPAPLTASQRLRMKATSPAAKKSSDRPVLGGQETLVDEVVQTKRELEDLKARYEELEAALIAASYPLYDADNSRLNSTSSVFCTGSKTPGLIHVYSERFSLIPVEEEDNLRKIDPNFDQHFVEVRDLKVKKDAGKTISDETVEKLYAALGEDFDRIFEVKVGLGARSGISGPGWSTVPKEIRDRLRELQAKPSVRIATVDGKAI